MINGRSAAVDFTRARWCKSSFSGQNTDCVEVACVRTHVGIRDSKNAASGVLVFSADRWGAFLHGISSGR